MNLGEKINHHRLKSNMSQADLADALEVSRQSVSKWETNASVPELNKLVRMSEVFNISLDQLIKGEKSEEIQSEEIKIEQKNIDTNIRKSGLLARQIVGLSFSGIDYGDRPFDLPVT